MRRSRLTLAAAATAVVAIALAGCGGGASAGAVSGGAASVAPADTAAFVAVDSDLGSAQWQRLDGLLAGVTPNGSPLSQLEQAIRARSGLDWKTEVQPALGPEVDVAVLPAASGGTPQVVVLTQPDDAAKLRTLLAKLDAKAPAGRTLQTATVGDWTAVSDTRAALDAFTGATDHLADSTVYQQATAQLADDALARAYANGGEAKQLVAALGGALPSGGKQVVWAAGDAVASGDALKLDAFVQASGGSPAQPYDAALLDRIPGDTLAVADFVPRHGALPAAAATPLAGALRSLGTTLSGETAVYVSPGSPLPAVTLVTHGTDPKPLVDALHGLLANAGSALPQGKTGFDLGSLLGGLQLSQAVVGDDVVVSTSQAAVDAFRGGGAKLSDDSTFRDAGVPAQTTGFVYVDLKDAGSLLQGLAQLGGGTNAVPSLGSLQSLTAYGSYTSGGISRMTMVLRANAS